MYERDERANRTTPSGRGCPCGTWTSPSRTDLSEFPTPHRKANLAKVAGEACHFAAGVSNGGKNDVRPEARAVFAYAPAFILNAPSLCRPLQQLSGAAVVNVFLGEEAGEVFADNLVGCVLFGALCARIPRSDVTNFVEKVDGIIAHAIEQRAQLQVFMPDKLLCFMLLRYVAHDAEDACTRRCLQWLEHDVDRKFGAVFA